MFLYIAGDILLLFSTSFLRNMFTVHAILATLWQSRIYSYLFDFIVQMMNENLNASASHHYVGILDMAGFENVNHNSFEQFCINCANEKLNQLLIDIVLKTTHKEYEMEVMSKFSVNIHYPYDICSIYY